MNLKIVLRVAVITPYYQETSDVLSRCLASVAEQTYPCTHFLVADGHPQDLAARAGVEHFILPRGHRDGGSLARAVGSLSAISRGFDAITYLDADNWYYPDHIGSMVALHRATGAAVCTAARTIHRLDGSLMFTDRESDGVRHVDTSCLFLTRLAFPVVSVWGLMPPQLGPICDKVVWGVIRFRQYPTAHSPNPTVAFRTQYQLHYKALGEASPPGTKSIAESTGLAHKWWASLPAEERDWWSHQLGVRLWI